MYKNKHTIWQKPLKSAVIILFIMAYTAQSALCATPFALRTVREVEQQEVDRGIAQDLRDSNGPPLKQMPEERMAALMRFLFQLTREGLLPTGHDGLLGLERKDISRIFEMWNERGNELVRQFEEERERQKHWSRKTLGAKPVVVMFHDSMVKDVYEYVLREARTKDDEKEAWRAAKNNLIGVLSQAALYEYRLEKFLRDIKEGLSKHAEDLEFDMGLLDTIEFVFGKSPSQYESSHSLEEHPDENRDNPIFYIRLIDSIDTFESGESKRDPFTKGVVAREIGHLVACNDKPFRFTAEQIGRVVSGHPFLEGLDIPFNRSVGIYGKEGEDRVDLTDTSNRKLMSAAYHLNELIGLYCSMHMIDPRKKVFTERDFEDCARHMARRCLNNCRKAGRSINKSEAASVCAFLAAWEGKRPEESTAAELYNVMSRAKSEEKYFFETVLDDYIGCLQRLRYVVGDEDRTSTTMVKILPRVYPANPANAKELVGVWKRQSDNRWIQILFGDAMHIFKQHVDASTSYKARNGKLPLAFFGNLYEGRRPSRVSVETAEDFQQNKPLMLCIKELAQHGRCYVDLAVDWEDEVVIRILPEEHALTNMGVRVLGGYIRPQPNQTADRVTSMYPMFGPEVAVYEKGATTETPQENLNFVQAFKKIQSREGDNATYMRWGAIPKTKGKEPWGMAALIDYPKWTKVLEERPRILDEDIVILTYYAICFGEGSSTVAHGGRIQNAYEFDVAEFISQAERFLTKTHLSGRRGKDSRNVKRVKNIIAGVTRFYEDLQTNEGLERVVLYVTDDWEDPIGIDLEFKEDARPADAAVSGIEQWRELQRHP